MPSHTPNEKQILQQAILQLGQRALAQLELEAKAAQIQAKQAELALLMEQAHQGNLAPLQHWLRIHGKHVASPSEQPLETPSPAPSEKLENAESIQGWDELALHARQRLSQLTRHALTGSETDPSLRAEFDESKQASSSDRVKSTELGPSGTGLSRLSNADIRADAPHTEHLLQEKDLACDNADDVTSLQVDDGVKQHEEDLESLPIIDGLVLTKPLDQIINDLGLDLARPMAAQPATQKGRWRGAIISAVFHLILIGLLAVVTIESPVKHGLLALVSGGNEESTEIESFEITNEQVVEPTPSTEMTEPTSQTNFAEVLPGLSDSVTQSLSESLSSPSPVESKSNLMAAKAGPAKNVMSFYGAESTGNSFCFVLDGSGSMRGGPWEAARRELLKSIGSLKPTQRFYVIFFNKEVLAITEPGSSAPASNPLLATPENLAHAKRWLDTLEIMTGEPPMKALEVALELECDCIYFLADGEMSDNIAKRLLDMLRKKNRTMDILDGELVMIPIHTIAYYSDKGLEIMRRIAQENRGQFAYVPKPKSTRGGK